MARLESIRVDVSPLLAPGGTRRGDGQYLVNLLRALRGLPGAPRLELFDPLREELRPLDLPLDVWPLPEGQGLAGLVQRTRAYWARPPRRGEVVVFGSPWALPVRLPERSLVVVHDLARARRGRWFRWLRNQVRGWRLRGAARVVAVSEFSGREAREVWGLEAQRVVAVPHLLGPPPEVPSPAPPRVRQVAGGGAYVLYLGAWTRRKGLLGLLEAWRGRPGRGVRLVVAGGGEADPEVEVALAMAEASGDVAVLPGVDEDEKVALLAAAACLVLPSRYEGYGLAVAEAMRVGTPALAFDNSGLREAMGTGGTLISDGDFEGLLAMAMAMAVSPSLRATASASARAWIRGLDQEAIAARFLEVCREASAG